jgi:hypothetical protein
VLVERDDLDLGAPDIDPDPHRRTRLPPAEESVGRIDTAARKSVKS